MKRLALLVVLVAGVVLILPGSGSCDIIVDNDYEYPGPHPNDVIGPQLYQIYAWDITPVGETIDIKIFTDFDGYHPLSATGPISSTWNTFAGDLMISAGNGYYEWGVAFTGDSVYHAGLTQGTLYHVTDWKRSDEHNPGYGLPPITQPDFDYRPGVDVTIDSLAETTGASYAVGDGVVTAFKFAEPNTVYGSGTYMYHVALDLAGVPDLSAADIDGFYWAVATCGNDIIEDSPTFTAVPEPATVFLVGCGLVGLAGYGRRKRISGAKSA